MRGRVVFPRLGDVRVAVHAGELSRVDNGVRGDLRQRPGAVAAETSIIRGDEQRAQHHKDEGPRREDRGKAKQVLVRSEWRHCGGTGQTRCLPGSRRLPRISREEATGCELLGGAAQNLPNHKSLITNH